MPSIIYRPKDKQSGIIEGMIESGAYKDQEEVIDAALELLGGETPHRPGIDKVQRLRRLIEEGLNSGPAETVDEDKFLREIKAEL